MNRSFLAALGAALSLSATAEEPVRYLCVEDLASGVSYNEDAQRWEQENNFRGGHRFLIKPLSGNAAGQYGVFVYGRNVPPIAMCADGFSDDGVLLCEGSQRFVFSLNDGRYQRSYAPDDVQIIAVGSCEETR